MLLAAWMAAVPPFVGGMLVCWVAMLGGQQVVEATRTVAERRLRDRFDMRVEGKYRTEPQYLVLIRFGSVLRSLVSE